MYCMQEKNISIKNEASSRSPERIFSSLNALAGNSREAAVRWTHPEKPEFIGFKGIGATVSCFFSNFRPVFSPVVRLAMLPGD
jgi:hypothetical protein